MDPYCLSMITGHIHHRFTLTLVSHSICLFTYDIAYESIKALVVGSLDTSLTPRIHIVYEMMVDSETESCRATRWNVCKLH